MCIKCVRYCQKSAVGHDKTHKTIPKSINPLRMLLSHVGSCFSKFHYDSWLRFVCFASHWQWITAEWFFTNRSFRMKCFLIIGNKNCSTIQSFRWFHSINNFIRICWNSKNLNSLSLKSNTRHSRIKSYFRHRLHASIFVWCFSIIVI